MKAPETEGERPAGEQVDPAVLAGQSRDDNERTAAAHQDEGG